MIGSVPYKNLGTGDHPCTEPVFGEWETIADCCIGCANMSFSITGSACQIIWDNGNVDLGPTKGGDPSGINRGIFSRGRRQPRRQALPHRDHLLDRGLRLDQLHAGLRFPRDLRQLLQPAQRRHPSQRHPDRHRRTRRDPHHRRRHLPPRQTRVLEHQLDAPGRPQLLALRRRRGAGSFNARSFFAYSEPDSPCGCEATRIV